YSVISLQLSVPNLQVSGTKCNTGREAHRRCSADLEVGTEMPHGHPARDRAWPRRPCDVSGYAQLFCVTPSARQARRYLNPWTVILPPLPPSKGDKYENRH